MVPTRDFIVAIVAVFALTLLSVVVLDIARPSSDNTVLTVVIGFGSATISGVFLALKAMRDIHYMVNSRLTEFISLTAKSAKAEGVLEQKEKEA